jgi:hypothetical protein
MGVLSCPIALGGTAMGGFHGSSMDFGFARVLGFCWGGVEGFFVFFFREFFQNGFIPHPP